MAAGLRMGTYAPNDLVSILESSGSSWQDSFDQNPELLLAWDHYLRLTGATNEQARLYAPEQWSERVRSSNAKSSSRLSREQAKDILKEERLVAQIQAGPYVVILCQNYIRETKATRVWPHVFRKFPPHGYRLTGEVFLSDLVMYVASLAPGVMDPQRASRKLVADDVRGLVAFEETFRLPDAEREHAARVFWRADGYKPGGDEGRVYIFCRVEADRAKGYGMRIEELARPADSAGERSEAWRLGSLLWQSMHVATLDEQKRLWTKASAGLLDENHRNRLESYATMRNRLDPEQETRSAARNCTQVVVEPGFALIAGVPSEYGTYFYLGDSCVLTGGHCARAALVQEEGSWLLSPSLDVDHKQERAGLISGGLMNPSLISAIMECVRAGFPEGAQWAASASHPASSPH
jgi:hypothetical protein